MLKSGLYLAENNDSIYDAYTIKMKVKETEKTFIFELVELSSRFSAPHMKKLFQNSKRFWLRKSRGGHGIQCIGDDCFTFYPYQAGIPYAFNLVSGDTVIGTKDISDERTKKAFEHFKLQWMLDHGYTLADLMECMEVMVHEDSLDGLHTKLSELFERWEFGVGFVDGSVWSCYDEYLQNPDEWEEYAELPVFEGNDFSFTETTAWSNLDDDQLCDWLIVPLT